LRANGTTHQVQIDPRATVLDTLREMLHLTGTKKGCDHGQCGACTVHLNGRRVNSCLLLAAMHQNAEITTIAGLGTPEQMHQVPNGRHPSYGVPLCRSAVRRLRSMRPSTQAFDLGLGALTSVRRRLFFAQSAKRDVRWLHGLM
jgi:hypothetical protein